MSWSPAITACRRISSPTSAAAGQAAARRPCRSLRRARRPGRPADQPPTAQEALEKQGVAFPEGAIASYSAATNTLHMVNTPLNQDMISQIVEALSQTEPVTISVQVTMIKTQQTNLKELGYDWLIDPLINLRRRILSRRRHRRQHTGRTGVGLHRPDSPRSGVPGRHREPRRHHQRPALGRLRRRHPTASTT